MARILKAGTPLGEDLVLVRMSGQEELGRLPEFQLEFTSPRRSITATDILGKNISWALELAGSAARFFNGFVTRFAEAGEAKTGAFEEARTGKTYFYHATVHPWLWFLSRASNCRVFKDKTVPEIVAEVFQKYPFASFEDRLGQAYPQREFCVQYRETDFNFVCRLLEQEGIYFTFEYDNGSNKLVLVDAPAPGAAPAVPFFSSGEADATRDHMTAWAVNREIQPGKYTVDDFEYLEHRRMSGDLSLPKEHDLAGFEIYDYPGEYDKPEDGPEYAKTRLEEMQVRYEQFSGSGNVRLAKPGWRFALTGHPRGHYNAEYLVTAVSYTASAGDVGSGAGGAGFDCGVAAIAFEVPFRPARITPKPIIQGPQTAIVVGPSGEEIHTDEHGRVMVQFHWDRYGDAYDKCSAWVRVAQPLAGGKWGFFALPRVGHEVVVEFLEGDPDHPIVTGSVYNGELKPPYDLGQDKTRTGIKTHSSPGGDSTNFNELRFVDKKGEEEIYFHAEKDKNIRIKNDRREWIGNNNHLIVTLDAFEKIEGDHHVSVTGDRNEKLDGTLSLDIGGDLHGKMTKLAYDATNEIHLKASTLMVLESDTKISLKVGGNFINIDSSGVTIQGTLTKINSGGSAGTGSGASPNPPTEPEEAGESEGGEMTEPPERVPPEDYSPRAQMFVMAAQNGTPFVAPPCNC